MKGIGIDIAEIGFFRQRPYAAHSAFYDLVFTDHERRRCLARRDPETGFALCFATKEAVVKALSSCGDALASVTTIQVESVGTGKKSGDTEMPIRLRSRRGETPPTLNGLRIQVACSATRDLATAVVSVSDARNEGELL